MKFLGVGLGSIGQRHFKNIHELHLGELYAYREMNIPLRTIDSSIITTQYNNYDEALSISPGVVIISNPTSMHVEYAIKAAEKGCHLLIEKPLSNSLTNVDKLLEVVNKNNLKVLIGCNLRFLPLFSYIKEVVQNEKLGRLYAIQATFGKHIDTWHPWEDYKDSYACRKDLGGGIILTLIHELDYLYWLFGIPQSIISNNSHNLGLDVEDTADILLKYSNGLNANIHLDYINRKFTRELKIIGEFGTLTYDIVNQIVTTYVDDMEIRRFGSHKDFDESYKKEMLHLIECINENKKPMCSLEDGIEVLKIALGARYES